MIFGSGLTSFRPLKYISRGTFSVNECGIKFLRDASKELFIPRFHYCFQLNWTTLREPHFRAGFCFEGKSRNVFGREIDTKGMEEKLNSNENFFWSNESR